MLFSCGFGSHFGAWIRVEDVQNVKKVCIPRASGPQGSPRAFQSSLERVQRLIKRIQAAKFQEFSHQRDPIFKIKSAIALSTTLLHTVSALSVLSVLQCVLSVYGFWSSSSRWEFIWVLGLVVVPVLLPVITSYFLLVYGVIRCFDIYLSI